jgi:hypothetical protein
MMENNNKLSIVVYYNRYCKILNKVITAAKKMAYDNCITKSYNILKKIINSLKKKIPVATTKYL